MGSGQSKDEKKLIVSTAPVASDKRASFFNRLAGISDATNASLQTPSTGGAGESSASPVPRSVTSESSGAVATSDTSSPQNLAQQPSADAITATVKSRREFFNRIQNLSDSGIAATAKKLGISLENSPTVSPASPPNPAVTRRGSKPSLRSSASENERLSQRANISLRDFHLFWCEASDAVSKHVIQTCGSSVFPDSISLQLLYGRLGDGENAYQEDKLSDPGAYIVAAATLYGQTKDDPAWRMGSDALTGHERLPFDEFQKVLKLPKDNAVTPLKMLKDILNQHTGNTPKGSPGGVPEQKPEVVTFCKDELVDALLWPLNQESTYSDMFFATFKLFMTPREVLTGLLQSFTLVLPENYTSKERAFYQKYRRPIQIRVIKVLLKWMYSYWEDFCESPSLMKDLQQLAEYFASADEKGEAPFYTDALKIRAAIHD